jgi:hypothetical protein
MDRAAVHSLGILSIGETQSVFASRSEEIRGLVGEIPEAERASIARYLRGGAIVFAAMEHTRDILGSSFETAGGSGILTDGEYFWRGDAADYVEHYGVQLPEDFVAHARRLQWVPPDVPRDRLLEIDRFLMSQRPPP